MKHLNDYINEHRIDEGGLRDTLFGEIVMKILGTGLDWIGKSVGWLADSFKGAVRQGWDSFKNVNSEVWHSYCRDTGFKFNRPRNEKEYGLLASQIIDSNKTYEEKFDAIERLDSITNGQTDMMCVTICKLCLTNAGNKDITKKHLEVYITDFILVFF